jgi:hypothetical protein
MAGVDKLFQCGGRHERRERESSRDGTPGQPLKRHSYRGPMCLVRVWHDRSDRELGVTPRPPGESLAPLDVAPQAGSDSAGVPTSILSSAHWPCMSDTGPSPAWKFPSQATASDTRLDRFVCQIVPGRESNFENIGEFGQGS